jgi:uncharacterized protein (DUF2147 family)
MKLKRSPAGICFLATLIVAQVQMLPAQAAVPAAPELGVWLDDSGQGAIEIANCGPKLCGRIVWLKQPTNAKGEPEVDSLNPSPAKRTRMVCGIQVIGDLTRQNDGSWDNGWVYDPKVGEAYDLSISMKDTTHLAVTGYKGVKLFGKTFIWSRAKSPLPPCAARTP